MAEQWYYVKDGQQVGPVAAAQLKQLVGQGSLTPNDLVRKDGMTVWAQASKVKGLFPPVAPPPQPVPAIPPISELISSPARANDLPLQGEVRKVFRMKGVSEELLVFEDRVTITPKGAMGLLVKGLKGTKSIPFYSVSAIQYKMPERCSVATYSSPSLAATRVRAAFLLRLLMRTLLCSPAVKTIPEQSRSRII